MGQYKPGRKRPIVVKFKFHQDNLRVKQEAYTKLKDNEQYKVSDQYPREIKDRRRILYPVMQQAKREGKRAVMNLDKLYVNGTLITADSVGSTANKNGARGNGGN